MMARFGEAGFGGFWTHMIPTVCFPFHCLNSGFMRNDFMMVMVADWRRLIHTLGRSIYIGRFGGGGNTRLVHI